MVTGRKGTRHTATSRNIWRHGRSLAVLLLGLVSLVQPIQAQRGNPLEGDDDAISAGRPLYEARCSDCHSADARGVRGPDLTQVWTNGGTDEQVFETVRNGIEGTIMPPSQAPADEIWAIVAYLRSISTVPPFEIPGADADEGHALFQRECEACHAVAGKGGALGPDLSRIALGRSRDALTRSIREPSDSIDSAYKAVVLTTPGGDPIEGIVRHEDAFSIQVIDTNGRLQGYLKRDLAMVTHSTESLMPRFGRRRLSARELDDLLAYLATLR